MDNYDPEDQPLEHNETYTARGSQYSSRITTQRANRNILLYKDAEDRRGKKESVRKSFL